MMKMKKGLSKRSFYDEYYDGNITGVGQCFDEDLQKIVDVPDYWGFKISNDDKGYIEDASDDWYLDMINGKIQRIG